MKGGIARSNTTARPGSSTSQPMIRCVSGQSFSAPPMIVARPSAPALDHGSRGPVTEKSGGDDGGGIVAIEPDGDRAGFDRDEQPARAGVGRREPRRGGEAIHAARATEAEDGDALRIVAQTDTRTDPRFEARRCDAGRRYRDDAVDLVWRQVRLFDRRQGRLFEQGFGRPQVNGVPVVPAVAFLVPRGGGDDVPLGDPRIVENTRQSVEQGFLATKCPASAFFRLVLTNAVGRDGRRQGKKAARLHVEPYSAPAACRSHGLCE